MPLAAILNRFRFILLRNCGHKPWIEQKRLATSFSEFSKGKQRHHEKPVEPLQVMAHAMCRGRAYRIVIAHSAFSNPHSSLPSEVFPASDRESCRYSREFLHHGC